MLRTFRLLGLLVLTLSLPIGAAAKTSGINLAYMDTTCSPCRDFYRHANGRWLDTIEIPASYTGIGSGREMFDRNQETLYRVLERAAQKAPTEKDATLRKLGSLYAVLMDSVRADREGVAPIAADLERIRAIQTKTDLRREFARFAALGLPAPFTFGPEADPKQSMQTIGQIFQGGLALPERDFYFRTDGKSDTLRRDYVTFMERTFQLAGAKPEQAKGNAERILRLETALAESSLTRVQMRDPHALYHKMSVKELGALAPAIDWSAFFSEAGVPSLAKPEAQLDVSVPAFMRQLNAQIETVPLETWRAYLEWNLLRAAAPWLGQKFFDETFAFQSKLVGTKAPQPRWKRSANLVDASMGEALGKAYVETEFPADSKKRMLEMVDNLQAAFRERIANRPWMSETTKKQATRKLDAVMKKIGYPDTWRDYSALQVDAKASAVQNLRQAQEFEQRRQLAKIGKPVDRTEWGMSPPTVNAYYNPTFNEIVFPAGILQPPRFDPRADDAVNYGAIGMVIGHELTHGFDDEGRQYDAEGNLKDWWTEDDAKKFDALAKQVVEQYDAYLAVDTLRVNGKLTLGENIADLGGLTIAYEAWRRSLGGKPAPKIDGLTGEQRFFLGHAQGWRNKWRPEITRLVVLSDPHSPPVWRVNGPLAKMVEFRQAFGCKAGDAMVQEPILIW
ncbi:MAG TPA: M13 family metallopeptidase [Candidatus Limnocylindria bacterium]|nr:M13 family metallopeptidase [Candidatus Limnocylindria bacterium]